MILLISGASHTGKTLLAQKMLEKYHYPTLSLDLLKMGLIRSGETKLTPEDDGELEEYLWPIVREMVKTAIENNQNLVVEGGYIPFHWQRDFDENYLKHIRFVCLVMSEGYIQNHFDRIRSNASVIEDRGDDSWFTKEICLEENRRNLEQCRKYGCPHILIDEDYQVDLELEKESLMKQNYYGSLCTEMYEILHAEAPQDELDFYLSYARPGMKILEALCGSGRFFVPFLERGLDICGVDASREMLGKLQEKVPGARVVCADVTQYAPEEKFDYIFISSGSVSLFTDMSLCRTILGRMKDLLAPGGKFVFAVDTVACRCPEDDDCKTAVAVKTKEGFDLLLKTRDHYDEAAQTQFSPSSYELYDGEKLLQQEPMDFQTHLYRFGELEPVLKELGFATVRTYADYEKTPAQDEKTEMFLYECCVSAQ